MGLFSCMCDMLADEPDNSSRTEYSTQRDEYGRRRTVHDDDDVSLTSTYYHHDD